MLGLWPGELLVWCYGFLADWVIDLRVEAVTSDDDDGAGSCVRAVDGLVLRSGVEGWPSSSGGKTHAVWARCSIVSMSSARVSISLVNRRLTGLEVDSCDSSCKSDRTRRPRQRRHRRRSGAYGRASLNARSDAICRVRRCRSSSRSMAAMCIPRRRPHGVMAGSRPCAAPSRRPMVGSTTPSSPRGCNQTSWSRSFPTAPSTWLVGPT